MELLRKALPRARQKALKELPIRSFYSGRTPSWAITDVQCTITYVNDKFCANHQYPVDELIGP